MTPTADAVARERDLNSLYILTVVVVLAIVTMTFGALVFAFVYRSQVSLNWNHIVLPPILWASSAVLVASSFMCELARRRIMRGDQAGFFRYMSITTVLAGLFLIGQLIAWLQVLQTGVLLDKNPHPSFIFIFSGLHGAHILVGLAGFIYLMMRTKVPAGGPKYQAMTRVVANSVSVFWHYLDFVWFVLFTLLLTWRR